MKHTRLTLTFLIFLILGLFAYGSLHNWAEPIDIAGCRVDCRTCEFSRYVYQTHHCFCNCNGVEIQLY